MMKCNAPIDPATRTALSGNALRIALANSDAPRCPQELDADDVFCPSCGARVVIASRGSATPRSSKIRRLFRWFSLSGRAPRAEFWSRLVAYLAFNVLAYLILMYLFSSDLSVCLLMGLVGLLLCAQLVKASVRRLHDMNRSGWWIIPILVFPFAASAASVGSGSSNAFSVACEVCALILDLAAIAWLGLVKGTRGSNKYGADPLSVR